MKKLTKEKVIQIVDAAIAKTLYCSAGPIHPATSFSDDLDADSLDMYELRIEVEKKICSALGAKINLDSALQDADTVQEFYDVCVEQLHRHGFLS